MTTGSLPSITATQELVVPKSIPMIFPIVSVFSLFSIDKQAVQSLCHRPVKAFLTGKEQKMAGMV